MSLSVVLVLVGVMVGPLCEEGEGDSCSEGAEDDNGTVEFSEEHGVSMTKPPPAAHVWRQANKDERRFTAPRRFS